jgi:hypothetical protein
MSEAAIRLDRTPNGWRIFDADAPVLLYEYSFGPGTANALAVRGGGGLVVVSPPCRVGAGVFDDLARYGTVAALVAPNAFHLMGIPEWKKRFPAAAVFAPAQSVARVQRRTRLHEIRPLAELTPLASPRAEFVDMPHYRTGEALVRVRTGRGLAWYLTDIVMNLQRLPNNPIASMAFRLSGSAPGLRLNNVAPLFMVRDKAGLKRWLAAEVENAPPAWLIPAHGEIVELGSDPGPLRRLFSTG